MRTVATGLVASALAACSAAAPDLLGGREKCWRETEPRLATLMKGTLELDPARSELDTPEGERFALIFPALIVKSDTQGTAIFDERGTAIAREGELVTVFGGLGADEAIAVCAIEDRHGS